MIDRGAGGRCCRWGPPAALVLLLVACANRPAVMSPRPCDQIDDRPGLRDELHRLKDIPGDPYQRTRWYVLDADVSCAGNRSLGAQPISATAEKPSWWARIGSCFGL